MKNLILIIVVFLTACTKKTEPLGADCGKMHYYITSSDLLNARFKIGTYWVYLDSISMNTDSSVVDYNSTADYVNCSTSQRFVFGVTSFPSNSKTSYSIYPSGIFKDSNFDFKIYTDFNIKDNSQGFNFSYFDSLYIYDRFYKKVEKIINGKSIYYSNSDFGILRMDVLDNTNAVISKKLVMRKNIVK